MFKELRGDEIRNEIDEYIHSSVAELAERGIVPKLAIIGEDDDDGQVYYEKAILKRGKEYGVEIQLTNFNCKVRQAEIEEALHELNDDESVHGILVLTPLPEGIDDDHIRTIIRPDKDVDAVTNISVAELFTDKEDAFVACTAEACMEILNHYKIGTEGKRVTVVGRSLTIGKPLSLLMLNENATVTVCHSKTRKKDVVKACRDADIVVLAAGMTQYYGSEFFRDGQIVLDVGTGTGKDGKMHGDLDIDEIKESEAIHDMSYTPVPGGVGMVTTAVLFRNIIKAIHKKSKKDARE